MHDLKMAFLWVLFIMFCLCLLVGFIGGVNYLCSLGEPPPADHERIGMIDGNDVRRIQVEGGWLYLVRRSGHAPAACFVPKKEKP